MTLWKLSLKTFVLNLGALLSLMASLSTPVLSLETGYTYGTEETPATAELYRDLKCTYLFAAVTHMRLINLMLDDKDIPVSLPVGTVEHYEIRTAICTLYGVSNVNVGSLWLLLLYDSMVQYYYKQKIVYSTNEADRTEAVDVLVKIHNYMTVKMQNDLSGCRPENRFDSFEERHARLVAVMASSNKKKKDLIQNEALENCGELNILFERNNARSTFGARYEALRPRQLFLNNLGINKNLKLRLMNAYDVQVNWDDTSDKLKQYWEEAHKFYSPTVTFFPLFSIKTYYTGVFCLFKCIVYRLTWKFLFYVNPLIGELRENYLKKWHELLVYIQELLRLQNDQDFMGFMGTIDRFIRNDVDIDYVITKLLVKLRNIDVCIFCDATNQMVLEPDNFPSIVDQGTSSQAAIDYDSLKNAKTFIAHLKSSFRMVDFDVIRSIMLYINNESRW